MVTGMPDREKVIRPLQEKLDEVKDAGLGVMICSTKIIEKVIAMLENFEFYRYEYYTH